MLRMFGVEAGILRAQPVVSDDVSASLNAAIWIDAHEPTSNERKELNAFLRAELPESDDVDEIEFSARYFQDSVGIHVHSLFLSPMEGRHSTVTVAFILQDKRLVSVRDGDLADFRLLRMRIRGGQIKVDSPQNLLITIFEQKVENLADVLEDIHRKLEEVSYMVLEEEDPNLEDAIDRIAKLEDSNGKIRLCLMDTQRSISFLQRHLRNWVELQEIAREIKRDVDTLMSHTAFLFDKINFLMDSTQGFINIEQNQIIKTFSIAAVVFLPPTVVASFFGMNFEFIPGLHWEHGYLMGTFVMIFSAIAPFCYFKYKDWL